MCGMYSVGALVGRVGRRARTLSWLGIPLLAGGIVLTALWLIPVTTPTVHVQWADEINVEQRTAFERQRSLVHVHAVTMVPGRTCSKTPLTPTSP